MKIAHIGHTDLYGNRFNGEDLGNYLRERGHSSNHLVWEKKGSSEYTVSLKDNFPLSNHDKVIYDIQNSLFDTQSLFYPYSYALFFDERIIQCDLIHLHLIHNGFFNLDHLPILTSLKPTVWTLHDPWALTGHCIYPLQCNKWKYGCGNCPNLEIPFKIKHDTTSFNWIYKKSIFDRSNFEVIVASHWMKNLVNESPLFNEKKVSVVPFGIDTDIFCHRNSLNAKSEMGISSADFVIAFRADKSPFKGLEHIKEALHSIKSKKNITLITFGRTGLLEDIKNKYKIIELGWITDDYQLSNAYAAADIFLMPSNAEAFGLMAIEAMACGKPVIISEGTSLEEVVKVNESGCPVVPKDSEKGLLRAIENLMNNSQIRNSIGKKSRDVAVKYYGIDGYMDNIISVYRRVAEYQKINHKYSDAKKIIPNKKYKKSIISEKDDLILADLIRRILKNSVRGKITFLFFKIVTNISKIINIRKLIKKIKFG